MMSGRCAAECLGTPFAANTTLTHTLSHKHEYAAECVNMQFMLSTDLAQPYKSFKMNCNAVDGVTYICFVYSIL